MEELSIRLGYFANFLYNNFSTLNLFEIQHIGDCILDAEKIDKIQLIIDSINLKYYTYAFVNEFHISDRRAYHKYDYIHDLCIYGYDQTGLYTIGYNKRRIYGSNIVSYSDIKKSDPKDIILFKVKDTNHYDVDLEQIYNLLYDYLHPSNRTAIYKIWTLNGNVKYWGIEAVKWIFDYIRALKEGDIAKDIWPFQLLLEHKQLMIERLGYISKAYNIDFSRQIVEYERVVHLSRNMKFLFMKYKLTNKNSCLDEINLELKELLDKDQIILERVLLQIMAYLDYAAVSK